MITFKQDAQHVLESTPCTVSFVHVSPRFIQNTVVCSVFLSFMYRQGLYKTQWYVVCFFRSCIAKVYTKHSGM